MSGLAFDSELLRLDFVGAADMRRKVPAFHDSGAVEILDRLANTVDSIDPEFLEAFGDLFEESVSDGEAMHEMLQSVGISYFPKDASEFVRDYIAKRTGG